MMHVRRTSTLFIALWMPLALWQYARAASGCFDVAGWSVVLWSVQLAMLALPPLMIRRLTPATSDEARCDDTRTMVILLAYVPVTLALRIAERCGTLH